MKERAKLRKPLLWTRTCWGGILLIVLISLLAAPQHASCVEPPVYYSEYQVKALFLINFTKYVDWPTSALVKTNTPIVIGVTGEDGISDELRQIISTKKIDERPLVLKDVINAKDALGCHIVFISASEKERIPEILKSITDLPILTVSETEQFLQRGGVINMVMKANKVRLEVNLTAARRAQLVISSRLLGVADTVLGRGENK